MIMYVMEKKNQMGFYSDWGFWGPEYMVGFGGLGSVEGEQIFIQGESS